MTVELLAEPTELSPRVTESSTSDTRDWAVRINLGSGPVQPDGWINIDGSNRAWLVAHWPRLDRLLVRCGLIAPTDFHPGIRYANLLKPFRLSDSSVDAVYMGEILEHFTREEGLFVLNECRRVLRPGGRIRIRVPDHARFWSSYIAEYRSQLAAPRGRRTLAHTRWTEMCFRTICTARPKPWQSMGHYHKWMYDDVSLAITLEQVGFVDAQRLPFHHSEIPGIADVEVRDDLIMEAAVAGDGHGTRAI